MPDSAEAALVFLVLFIPGYLYLAGYRMGRAVVEHREGIATVAKVIAISAVIAVVAWKLGGRELYDQARRGSPLTEDEPETWRFAVAILAIPGLLGFVAGEIVDGAARRLGEARERRPDPIASRFSRVVDKGLAVLSARLLHEGPTTWGPLLAASSSDAGLRVRAGPDQDGPGDCRNDD